MRKNRFNYDIETIALKRIKRDIELYREHEKNLVDEVKLEKLDDLLQRIRGISYCLGHENEKVIELRNLILDNKTYVFNKLYEHGYPEE